MHQQRLKVFLIWTSHLSRRQPAWWKRCPSEQGRCGTRVGSCSTSPDAVHQDSGCGWWKLLPLQQEGWCVSPSLTGLSAAHSPQLPTASYCGERYASTSIKWKQPCPSSINQKWSVNKELQRPSTQLEPPRCSNSRDLQRLCLQCCMCST